MHACVFGVQFQSVNTLSNEGAQRQIQSLTKVAKIAFSVEILADVKRHVKLYACAPHARRPILMLEASYANFSDRSGGKRIKTDPKGCYDARY